MNIDHFKFYSVGWDRSVGLQAAGPRHTRYRKLLNTMLNPTEVRKLQPLQERCAARLLLRLLKDPEHWYMHMRPSISEALVHICYGQDFPLEEFPYIAMAERAWWIFNNVATANSFAVDYLPICESLDAPISIDVTTLSYSKASTGVVPRCRL